MAVIVVSMASAHLADAAGTDPWIKSVGNTHAPIYDGFGSASNVPANKGVECIRVFNNLIYAAVGQDESGSGNPASLWRSSNLTNWAQVSGFSNVDVDVYSMETDGAAHLFIGTHATTNGANIYSSPNGSAWSLFNPGGSGFNRTQTTWASHMVVANSNLFAGILTVSGNGQVWKRPVNGSSSWAKTVDFQTGLGVPGATTNFGLKAFYFYAVSNTIFMSVANPDVGTNAFLYQSANLAGTNWTLNTAVGNGFCDTNNLNLACLVDFNGFLYATVRNPAAGGQIWRTPLSNALANGSQPWTEVVSNGFNQGGQIVSEPHHISSGMGWLWVSTLGGNEGAQPAQVWRSADGINWIQSNMDGFDSNNPATSFKPVVETFSNSVVWGGPSGTNATGAQVWSMQMAPPTITAQPQSISTNIGANVRFSVTATGVAPLTYQWRLNATNIVNASNATLGLNNVQPNNAGGYDVIVSNAVGSVTGLVAVLSVSPVITTNLPPPAGTVGTAYLLTLTAGGGAPPYTWALAAGALPDGLALGAGGQVSGTPTAAGTFIFNVQITDAIGQVATGMFCLAIADPWTQVVGNRIVPLGDGFGAGGVMNTNSTMIQSLTAYNGYLYAGVETASNRPAIWRSSDMLNWTNIPINAPSDFRNIFDMQSNSNGIFFGTGYGGFPSGAQIWKSTNGVVWSVFSTPASGFQTNYVNPVYVSLQGNALYAAPGSATSCQVWRRPADGSANWTELLDFNTGFGSADGVLTNMGISYVYCPPGATNAVFIPCGNNASSNCLLYVSADGGATWHLNAGVGNGFGDTNNGYIASVIEFNGYLYAGTGSANSSSGAQIWRTPLATATNWSSTNAWQQVVGGGFGYPSTEFHRFAVAGGKLWTFLFTHTNLKAKVWRSGDGMNWVQSNMDDFGTDDNAWNGALGSFTGTNGNSYMVWGGGWTSPTNANVEVAQIWATRFGEAGFTQHVLAVNSAYGGAMPAGTVATNSGTALFCFVTNSPVTAGGTQYVCAAGTVAGNAFTQLSPTNVTLTLTNDAALTWQWTTNYQFSVTAGLNGSATGTTNGWYALGGSVTVTSVPAQYYSFTCWTGDVPPGVTCRNPLSLTMDQARSVVANFAMNLGTNYGTPFPWLASFGYTNNMGSAELLAGSNGMPLWQSYVAGLDPKNAASLLRIGSIVNIPPLMVSFGSSTGRWYALERSTNLAPGNVWLVVAGQSNVCGNGGTLTLVDTNVSGSRFYRILVQLPQ